MFIGEAEKIERVNYVQSVPFAAIHIGAVVGFFLGFSWLAVTVCIVAYLIRMFAITGGYHRYFSHRTFKTSRVFQFLLALVGASTGQKGPLWWAAHHRHHHKHSDTADDIHSPVLRGIWWAHVGWVLCDKYLTYDKNDVKDFARFWELRVLDKFHWIVPAALAVVAYFSGHLLDVHMPRINITGLQMLCIGFCLSTVLVYHATFSINSLAHLVGRRRFQTTDDSKNSLALALVTLGEGWHNNHHRYPGSEKQGFYWWEVDVTHYTLKVLSWFRIVWDLRKPPRKIYEEAGTA